MVDDGVSVESLMSEENTALQQLYINGFLCIFAKGDQRYSFHTPLHLLYYQDQFLKARVEVCGSCLQLALMPLVLLQPPTARASATTCSFEQQEGTFVLHAHASIVQASAGTLEHFLQACISRLSSERLRTTLSVGVDGRMLERKMQVEFHAAALSVLPLGFNVCPDVGKVIYSSWAHAVRVHQ